MALALDKENYLLHKLHSLTGVIPVGYYMVQHLVLNSFTIAGPEKFNAVIGFFEGMPKHFLITLEICMIGIPILFHAIYGMFITYRAKPNYFGSVYGWSRNLMYTLQRWTGIFLFFFLIIHVTTTTGAKYYNHDAKLVDLLHRRCSNGFFPPRVWNLEFLHPLGNHGFRQGAERGSEVLLRVLRSRNLNRLGSPRRVPDSRKC